MDRFDRRDPEIHFRDLAQLRQTCATELDGHVRGIHHKVPEGGHGGDRYFRA
jgi:hypothetical protein